MGLETNQVVKESAKVMNTQKNWKWTLIVIPCGAAGGKMVAYLGTYGTAEEGWIADAVAFWEKQMEEG